MVDSCGRENKFDLKDVSIANKSNNDNTNKNKRQDKISWLKIENYDFWPIWLTYTIKKKICSHWQHFWYQMYGFVFTSANFLTPVECPSIQYSSENIYLELARDPTS